MQYQPKELGTVSCQVGAWAAARGQSTRTSPHACGSGVRHRGAAWAQAMRTYLASDPTLGNIPSETSHQYECDDVDPDVQLGSFRYVQLQELWEVQDFIRRFAG